LEQLRNVFGRGPPEGAIYDILRTDHRQIKASLNELVNERRINKPIFDQTVAALNMHMRGEETLFYPKLENNSTTRIAALKSSEEHRFARVMINDINATPADERWLTKILVLSEFLNRHIEVEENEVFPMARRVINDDEAMEMGRNYRTQTVSQPSQPVVPPSTQQSVQPSSQNPT
jgi:hemerythrin-like domain-containing protein